MASPIQLKNNAVGRLTSGVSSSATTLNLVSGDGAKFPTLTGAQYFPATLIRASDSAVEIVKVTARSGDVLTVVRGQEGTTGLVLLAGDRVELRFTAGTFTDEVARIEAIAQDAEDAAAAAQSTANSAQSTANSAQSTANSAQSTANSALSLASAAAPDTSVVKLTGDQTIAGVKTFSSAPKVPDGAAADEPATKGQLDAQIAAAAPPGAVLFFAMDTAPVGWLKADGSIVSRTAYAALFAAIGTTFGVGDGSTTFGLPDLRGEFIRGFDDGRGVDSARVLGSYQGHQMQSHTHATPQGLTASGFWSFNSGGNGVSTVSGAAGGTSNSSENRPRNIALLACIKY